MTEMRVLHVFMEEAEAEQLAHLEHWFGYPDARNEYFRGDDNVVCYCGARLVALKRNVKDASDIKVAGVWHREVWPDEHGEA